MSVSQPDIYTGVWTNWSKGNKVLGATITLSSTYSIFLTALLAVFIPAVGIQSWKVFCYCAHEVRVSKDSRDTLHHQLQVVLRNSSTPDGTAFTFLKQAWYWGKQSTSSAVRCLGWAVLAIAWSLVFAALGIVLPIAVVNLSDDLRQISSNTCGYYMPPNDGSSINDYNAKTLNDSITAAQYVSDCYVEMPDRHLCDGFAVPKLHRFAGTETSCPFATNVCLPGVQGYQIDSGYLDSLHELGINFPPKDRLKYRKVTTCAMLNDGGSYTQRSDLGTGYFYGMMSSGSNWTFYQYDALSRVESLGWRLDTFVNSRTEYTSWNPIDELRSDNADLSIFFLAPQGMTFVDPVNDPWFSAHKVREVPGFDDIYEADNLGRAMACNDQHQICNPQTRACTSLTHSLALRMERESPHLQLSDAQRLIASRFVYASNTGWISYSVDGRGSSALQASRTNSNYRQAALPANQWQREVDVWFDVSLARLQKNVRDFVTGPAIGGQTTAPQLVLPEEMTAMCDAQTVRNATGTTNFSALGVLLIFSIGGVIVVLGYTLDTVIGFVQFHVGKGLHRRIAWTINDELHLHRLVLQKAGVSEWHNRDGAVPWTAEERTFVIKPSSDLKGQPDVGSLVMTDD
ncbi:uncharacterized protein LTR77_000022 [Saxophila tyrrhenica]|uniref:Uncharacterized protein n=1 Tax=Saxophila tyrrhenica TaxID=1690608 RepID=A0AAV9PM57_9PEZI|nr:hypothetical protein LTR77_000022 [Saxophila tyrrhenica]